MDWRRIKAQFMRGLPYGLAFLLGMGIAGVVLQSTTYRLVNSLQRELETAQKALDESEPLIKRLHRLRFVKQSQMAAVGYRIRSMANPFHARVDEIREIRRSAKDVNDLWSKLAPIAREFTYFHNSNDKMVGAMLVVGALYDYGNPVPNEHKIGCVANSKETGFSRVPNVTFDNYRTSNIACCDDFAMLLKSFLSHLQIDSEVIATKPHQAVGVTIDGRQSYIDSNTLVFVPAFFELETKEPVRDVYYFAPYDGSRLEIFQQFLIRALMFEEPAYAPQDWSVLDPEEFDAKAKTLSLNPMQQ